jgi:1-phosphofructokinase family hexose kinase
MGAKSRAMGITFGPTGRQIQRILREIDVETEFIQVEEGNTRTNYLIIEDAGDCTIIAEKGNMLSKELLNRFVDLVDSTVQDGDYLVLSGDASNCSNAMIYNDILSAVKAKNIRTFLDTSGDILENCVKSSPFLIKPNLDELSMLCHKELKTDEEIVLALEELEKYNIGIIAVSLGGDGSIVKYNGKVYKATPPMARVCNTIGCGDCYLAGLVYGFHNQMEIEKILRVATAVSSASAESESSVGFDTKRAKELIDYVKVQKLK